MFRYHWKFEDYTIPAGFKLDPDLETRSFPANYDPLKITRLVLITYNQKSGKTSLVSSEEAASLNICRIVQEVSEVEGCFVYKS